MKSTKKPAIASEWRENKEAQERAEEERLAQERAAARALFVSRAVVLMRGLSTSVGLVCAILMCLFTVLALSSYTPADAGFSATGTVPVQNLAGLFGAWLADFLFWFFGAPAWMFIVGLAAFVLTSVRYLCARRDKVEMALRPVTTTLGFLLVLGSAVGLAALQMPYFNESFPQGAGGLTGNAIAVALTPYLGFWGTTALLTVLFFAGLSQLFHFSWISVAETVGERIEAIAKRLAQRKEDADAQQKADEMISNPDAAKVTSLSAGQSITFTPGAAAADEPAPAPEPAAAPQPKKSPKKRANKAEDSVQGELFTPENTRIAPRLSSLARPPADQKGVSQEAVEMTSRMIETKLKNYRIDAQVVGARVGPVITQYWLQLADGVRGDRVEQICKDLTRSLSVQSIRVVNAIPGKPYMGLEIPNGRDQRMAVYLREIIESPEFTQSASPLTLAIGKDIAGKPFTVNLAKLPHLLVGGTTGSGKSVAVNTMILSLLYKCDPSELKLVMIDPKTVEFAQYEGIPHLLCPVVTDMTKAANALGWLVNEMERRYSIMSKFNVRAADSFNEKARAAIAAGTPLLDPFDVTPDNPEPHKVLEPFPYIVCFIDELADLILVNRQQVELFIMRLAQKSRAAAIHLVLATQRPSRDIVTPLIKANIGARMCFQVASRYDSQVILEANGAQDLLGRGDMIFKLPGIGGSIRVQGCMVDEKEIQRVVEELKAQGAPEYVDAVTEGESEESTDGAPAAGFGAKKSGESDPLYDEAVEFVLQKGRVSTSLVQRRFGIGYNRAANIVESMEQAGLVSSPNAAGKREILANTGAV